MKRLPSTLAFLALWWLWVPLIVVIIWLIGHFLCGGLGVANESWDLWWNNHILNHSALLYFYIFIGAIGTAVITIANSSGDSGSVAEWALVVLAFIVAVGAFVPFFKLNWDSDKDLGRYYNSATTFYTPSLTNPPASLQYLLKSTSKEDNGCTTDTASDVPNCVKQGTMPQAGFAPRSSSASGALLAMQRTSGATENVDLLDSTLVYLQGQKEWTAIRDGSGNSAHTEGVVTWKGDGTPTECYFGGNDQFDKAIKGAHLNSLSNVMAKKYPTLYWTLGDSYGYCRNGRPVLVFVMREQTHYLSQTVSVPAGVVEVTGSASGQPVFKYKPDLTDAIGPSYPFSVAEAQVQANIWAAGRSDDDHGLFGYEADYISAQPFLLKSNTDGHTYIVVPMTLNSSQSQLFVAYAMIRADTVHAGHLNPLHIYVLATNDIRRINIDSLEASAKDYLSQQVPGFFSSGGQLVDFTPTSGDVWRAFAEINGRVVYRLDISASNAIQPDLVSLESFTGKGASKTPSNAICGKPLAGLTQTQIEGCIKTFAGALGGTSG
jgi:hypothetical protein